MKYTRGLIISNTRVNAADAENNGLLLRNLLIGRQKIWYRTTVVVATEILDSVEVITSLARKSA